MPASSVREAIRDAVAAFGPPGVEVPLPVPATCEAIFMAIQRVRIFAAGRPLLLIDQFSSLINELGHDAHRDFLNALRADLDSHRAGHALQLVGRGELLLGEMLEDRARLARAADHAQEQERPVNPLLEHQRVVPMPARDDQPKARHRRQRQRQQLFPHLGLQRDFRGKNW